MSTNTQRAKEPVVSTRRSESGNYFIVTWKWPNGREIEIHAHDFTGIPQEEKLWVSSNGPISIHPHCQNGVSIGTDHIYPPQP